MSEPVPLLFVFRQDWQRRAEQVRAGLAPAEGQGYFRLLARGADVRAADSTVRAGPLWRALALVYQRLYAVPRSGLGYRLDQARAVRALAAAEPHRVVVATTDSLGLPLLALRARGRLRNRVAVLSIGLGDAIARGRVAPALARRYLAHLRQAHAVFVFTPGERDVLGREGLENVHVLPVGVDAAWWGQRDPSPPRTAVLAVGRDPSRSFSTFVAAVAPIGAEATIVGTFARQQGVRPTPWLDVVDDVPFAELRRRFHGASLVVIPSRRSLYGSGQTTALQAMAAGRPVVMTDTGWARPGGLEPGVHFAEVPPEDAAALRGAIASLLADRDRAEQMGRRAQQAVAATFTVDRQADALLEGICAGRGAR